MEAHLLKLYFKDLVSKPLTQMAERENFSLMFHSVVFSLFLIQFLFAADPPTGFQDPKVLTKVLAGDLVLETLLNTDVEEKVTIKHFVPKVTTTKYIAEMTNYAKFPSAMPEVEEAQLLSVNPEKTEYSYRAKVAIGFKPFTFRTGIQGTQRILAPAPGANETVIVNNVTNNFRHSSIESADHSTRMIPYNEGLLLEETISVKLKNARSVTPRMARAKLKACFFSYIVAMRKFAGGL